MNNNSFYRNPLKRFMQAWRGLSRWLQIVLTALFLIFFWFLFIHTSGNAEKSAKDHGKNGAPVPVGAATVQTGDINIYLNGLGTVTPRNIVTVHTRVDGQLMRVLFGEGQAVKEGDLLAEIDPKPFQAQLEQAVGQMKRDQALLQEAKIDLVRYQTLFSQDSIAKQQLDTQASLVKQDEGTVENDKGAVDNAKTQLAYTHITSPINGRVGLRQVDPGNIVHAADANGLVVVTELQPITVIFALPEDNIPAVMQHIKTNPALAVEAWSRDDKIKLATGMLIAVDNEVNTTTGTLNFKGEFPNEDNTLFANQFVNVHMLLDTRKDATLMPSAAIQRGSQGTFVYMVKDDKTVGLQPVTLGPSEGENVSVKSGLKVGDVVVVDGGDSLRDGAKIEIASLDGKAVAAPEKADNASKGDKKDDAKTDGEHHSHKKPSDDSKGSP